MKSLLTILLLAVTLLCCAQEQKKETENEETFYASLEWTKTKKNKNYFHRALCGFNQREQALSQN